MNKNKFLMDKNSSVKTITSSFLQNHISMLKGTVMQIEKTLINDGLRVLKVSCKFRVPTIFNFAVIHP